MAIAAGLGHSAALQSDGRVIVWGGRPGYSQVTNVPADLSDAVAISAALDYTMALRADGSVTSWGRGAPSFVGQDYVAIAPGVALREDGTVVPAPSPGRLFRRGRNLRRQFLTFCCSQGGRDSRDLGRHKRFGIRKAPCRFQQCCGDWIACRSHSLVALGDGSLMITRQPPNRKVEAGGKTLLTVMAAGAPPLRYQWRFQESNLPEATNFWLRLSNLQPTNAGGYSVVVSNSSQAMTSKVAAVTVCLPPPPAGQALDAPSFVWANSGHAPWFSESNITHDGVAAAQSGAIGDLQQSRIQAVVTGPGGLSFWWKVSSEEWFDYVKFAINGQEKAAISGEKDWRLEHFAVPEGNNLLSWTYSKDSDSSAGLDAAWVDQVTYAIDPPVITLQPAGGVFSSGTELRLFVTASGVPPFSYQWSRDAIAVTEANRSWFSITNAKPQDSGRYSVAVSNIGGTTVSENALISVLAPPTLIVPVWLPRGGFTSPSRDAGRAPLTLEDLARFELQTSTNLIDWTTLTNDLTLTNGALLPRDPAATSGPQRFYRVRER